jgi:hypothetical protein
LIIKHLGPNMGSILLLCIAFFFGWAPAHLLAPFHFDLHHDGLILFNLKSFMDGLLPYKEFFIQHGLGTVQIQGIIGLVFGSQLIYLRELTAFFYGCATALTYLISRRFSSKTNAILVTFLWAGSAYYLSPYKALYLHAWSSVYALVCFLIIILIGCSKEKLSNSNLVTIGIFIALGALFKINYGLISLFCAIVIVHQKREKYSKYFKKFLFIGIGVLIIALPYLYNLYITDSIKNFYEQQIKYAFLFSNNNQSTFNPLLYFFKGIKVLFNWNNRHGGVSALNFFATYIIVILFLYHIFIKKVLLELNDRLCCIGICGLIANLLYFPVPSLMHIFLSGPLLFIFLMGLVAEKSVNKKLKSFLIIFLGIYFFWEVLFNHLYKFINIKMPIYSSYTLTPNAPYLKNIFVSDEMYSHLNAISKLQENPRGVKYSCYFNNTPQPYYSLLFGTLPSVTGNRIPFDWGYVNKTVGVELSVPPCLGELLIISSRPYLLKDYSLHNQFKIIDGQDFSTPITSYLPVTRKTKIDVYANLSIKSIDKSLSNSTEAKFQYVERYKELFNLDLVIDRQDIPINKKLIGVYLEISDASMPLAKSIPDEIDGYKLLKLDAFSTNPIASTGNLYIFANDKILSPSQITNMGINLPIEIKKIVITPNVHITPPFFYNLRLQFDDNTITEGSGMVK